MDHTDVNKILDEYSVDPVKYLLGILPRLQPNQQATIMLALLPYKYPKLKEVDDKRNGDGPNPADGVSVEDLLKFLHVNSSNESHRRAG